MDRSYTPEHLAYLERRYVDLKQVFEAVVSYFPPEAYSDNHLIDTIVCEFNYLADILGFEDDMAFLDRLIGNQDARDDDEDEDEEDDLFDDFEDDEDDDEDEEDNYLDEADSDGDKI